jgi:DNA (cytosine-5)-methyltransferase 1
MSMGRDLRLVRVSQTAVENTEASGLASTGGGLKFVDLFAGIGGFHLALANLGAECVLACDIDADCRSVYQKRWPDVPLRGDIRTDIVSRIAANDPDAVPPHDILCAGFPCQPFSKSGRQLGLRDKIRGTLFADIMEVIRFRHPRYVVLENVRNIAGPKHRDTWRTIVDSLREEGYRVASEPLVFSPHLLPPALNRRKLEGGRPQIRDRVYILAEFVGSGATGQPVRPLVSYAAVNGWKPESWKIDEYLQEDRKIDNLGDYRLRPEELRWLRAWQEFILMLSEPLPGFPIWVQAFESSPGIRADTPEWKATFLRKNSALYRAHRQEIDRWLKRWKVRETFPPSRQKFEWQARGHPRNIWKLVIHFRPSGIRVKPPTYVPALVAITQTSVIGWRRRRITPREAARLQGFPDRFPIHEDDSIAYKQLGNAVNVGAVTYVTRALLADAAERSKEPEQLTLVS